MNSDNDKQEIHHEFDSERNGIRDRIRHRLPYKWMKELWEIFLLALASTLLFLFLFTLQTEPIMISGHLSLEELDAVALSCTIITCIALSVCLGSSTAASTYFSQSYGGAHKKTIGIFLQTSLLAMTMTSLCVVSLFLNIRFIIRPLHQNPVVAEMSARYLMIASFGIPFDFVFYALTMFMFSQKRLAPPIVSALMGNILNVVSQFLAIHVFGYRYEASAVSRSCSIAFMVLLLVTIIMIQKAYAESWDGWTLEALDHMPSFYKLGVPAWIFFIMCYGSLEAGVFVLGSVNKVDMAAFAIIVTCSTFMVLNRVGIQEAMAIRIGHLVGYGDASGAVYSVKVGLILSAITGSICSILYILLRWELPKLFTSDPNVISAAATGFLFFAPWPLLNSLCITIIGALRGCAKQFRLAIVNIVCFVTLTYPIGVPLALLADLKAGGMWIGISVATVVQLFGLSILLYKVNWDDEIKSARVRCKRVKNEPQESDETENTVTVTEDSKLIVSDAHEEDAKRRRRAKIYAVISSGVILSVLLAAIVSFALQTPIVDLGDFYSCLGKNITVSRSLGTISC